MKNNVNFMEILEQEYNNITPSENAREDIEEAETVIPDNLMFDADIAEFKPVTKPQKHMAIKPLTVDEAKAFDDEIGHFVDAVLISGVDFGVIPKCNKPSLLKSGAEKLINFMGLVCRTEVVNRHEDWDNGFFAYECRSFLIDYNGVIRAVGLGSCNSKEPKFAKSSGFACQNTVLKMAKKRSLVDSALNVGNLSSKFTQDEDLIMIDEQLPYGKNPEELKSNDGSAKATNKVASAKQIQYLESLCTKSGTSLEALNNFAITNYRVTDYHKISSFQASELIEKFKAVV